MPRFMVLEQSYINDRLFEAGELVDFEPLKDAEGNLLFGANLELQDDDADEDDPKTRKRVRKAKEDAASGPAPVDVNVTDETVDV